MDARAFYHDIPLDQYPGQVMVCELYRLGGIRCCEIGSVMFGKYDVDGRLIPATMDLVRLAIPRRVYTQSHIDYAAQSAAKPTKSCLSCKSCQKNYSNAH